MKGCATLLSIPFALIWATIAASTITAALGLPSNAWWIVALVLLAIGMWCGSLSMNDEDPSG